MCVSSIVASDANQFFLRDHASGSYRLDTTVFSRTCIPMDAALAIFSCQETNKTIDFLRDHEEEQYLCA